MMDFESYFANHLKNISQHLDQLIVSRPGALHSHLFEAARYSLLSSAKRLRPLLTIATVETYGLPYKKALHPACALELIHTYSLIHDDLPCMDDDDMRRGKPTLHKVYNEGHAVLTGDFLLTFAFQVLSESPDLSDEQKIELIRSLSTHAGSDGLIGGQVVDLSYEGKEITWETLEFMHQNKTAALIATALEFGAIIARAPKSDVQTLKKFGRELGIAFQIIDDILDISNTDISSDQKKEKSTAVTFLGLQGAKEKAEELFLSSLATLDTLSHPAPLLKHLSHKLVHRSS